jgi:hypothetical protein
MMQDECNIHPLLRSKLNYFEGMEIYIRLLVFTTDSILLNLLPVSLVTAGAESSAGHQ